MRTSSRVLSCLLGATATTVGAGAQVQLRPVATARVHAAVHAEDDGVRRGRVTVDYEPVPWTAEVARDWQAAVAWRRALGGGDWTVLENDVPIEIGNSPVDPGRHYLGLQRFADGRFALLLYDPKHVARLEPKHAKAIIPYVVALGHQPAEGEARLAFALDADALRIEFGPHRFSTPLALRLPHHGLPDIGDRLPAEIAEVIETADAVEILALTPHLAEEGAREEDLFHGYPIRGRATLAAKEAWAVRREIYDGIRHSEKLVVDCFNPRHGLRARKGDDTVDLVICYSCFAIHVHATGRTATSTRTGSHVAERVDALFAAAGLKVAR